MKKRFRDCILNQTVQLSHNWSLEASRFHDISRQLEPQRYNLRSPLLFERGQIDEKEKRLSTSLPGAVGWVGGKNPKEERKGKGNPLSCWINEWAQDTDDLDKSVLILSFLTALFNHLRGVWCVPEHTDYLFILRVLLLANPDDDFSWWIEFLSVLRRKR